MPLLEEDGFAKLLKNDIRDNLFFIFGDDDYLKGFYCDRLVAKTVDESMKLFNYHVYQDDSTDLETIFAEAENLPMMAERTCLLVRNYPLQDLKKEQLARLEQMLDNLPETSVLIFFFNTIPVTYNGGKSGKWGGVVSMFLKRGVVVRLDHRSKEKIAAMLVRGAKERGAVIGQAEALYFAECVGDDLQFLLNEFNKLCAYSEGQPITKEMIDVTAVKSVEANVFEISASIFGGNTDKAFAIANELIRQKTELQPILGAMASAYVDIYRLKAALNAGRHTADFADAFGYKGNSSYRFRKIDGFARKSSIGSIRKAIDILAEADVRSKSSGADGAILLTETIAKLASCVSAGAAKKQ
ncbi:MAG: DNA polymerase III subunit delta [Clostridia bacterium]|nr:DNA polymerase III subunit delta [Clostridia bacterium]